jgi:hypothetical protein
MVDKIHRPEIQGRLTSPNNQCPTVADWRLAAVVEGGKSPFKFKLYRARLLGTLLSCIRRLFAMEARGNSDRADASF